MLVNLENSAVATGLEKVSFHSNPKECSNYCTTAFTSHASKSTLKILQARLQQYMNWELPDVQAGFRNQRSNCQHLLDHRKSKGIPKNICFIDCTKAILMVQITTNWKILKETGISDHLTCHLRNLNKGQEATVRTGHETTDWFKAGKGVYTGCILSCCLFNLHAKYIMWNAGLDEAQAEIKIAGRNINNLIYADDTSLMAESEELKSLLMKVKEEN